MENDLNLPWSVFVFFSNPKFADIRDASRRVIHNLANLPVETAAQIV